MRRKKEGDIKQELLKVSFPPLHHCLLPACCPPVHYFSSFITFNHRHPDLRGRSFPAEARQRPSLGAEVMRLIQKLSFKNCSLMDFFFPFCCVTASRFPNTSSVLSSLQCFISLELHPLLLSYQIASTHTHSHTQISAGVFLLTV